MSRTSRAHPSAVLVLSRRTLDRNWDELMQELRATQTRVQVLTAFLLTVPFSSRFGALVPLQRWLYLVVLGGSVTATCLTLAPVAFHRLLFRRGQRLMLVETANRLAIAGIATLLGTICTMVVLVVDVVFGSALALVAGSLALVMFLGVWVLAPLGLARLGRFPRNPPPDAPHLCGSAETGALRPGARLGMRATRRS
jgi:hypothetical protein